MPWKLPRLGGFPKSVLSDEARFRPLISLGVRLVMLYRDLIEGYGVRMKKLMRELLRHCYRNTASMINVSKQHRDSSRLVFRLEEHPSSIIWVSWRIPS